MPVMSIKVDRRYNGQQCISEYNYVASGVPASVSMSFALASAFGVVETAGVYPSGKPFATLRGIQNTEVHYVEAIAKDLYSVTDFYSVPFISNTNGTVDAAGSAMSSFVSATMRTNRIRSDIRRGFKRYEGMVEANIEPFGVLASGYLAAVDAHAVALSNTLTYTDEGNTLTFVPCIISLKKDTSDPDHTEYVKWPTEAEQLAHLASGVVWSSQNTITTQNSRKVGRGS